MSDLNHLALLATFPEFNLPLVEKRTHGVPEAGLWNPQAASDSWYTRRFVFSAYLAEGIGNFYSRGVPALGPHDLSTDLRDRIDMLRCDTNRHLRFGRGEAVVPDVDILDGISHGVLLTQSTWHHHSCKTGTAPQSQSYMPFESNSLRQRR